MAEEQAGFVEGKGTREQLVNIRSILEKWRDQNIPLYMCFIDYAKAFDCVTHKKLWDTVEQVGFPVHIIQLVTNLYKEQVSVVRTTNGDTDWLKIERGLRQGCVISPGLIASTSRTISYDGSCHRYSPIVRDSATTRRDRSRSNIADRSHLGPIATNRTVQKSYDPV